MLFDDFEIKVIRKNIKNINLRIYKDSGEIKLSIPFGISEEYVLNFLSAKKDWLQKHCPVKPYLQNKKQQFYADQNKIPFRGEEYVLKINYTDSSYNITLTDSKIEVFVPDNSSKSRINDLIDDWYRINLQIHGEELISKWEKIIGVKSNEFKIRKMKTRWGSCNFRVKRIWLNLELIKKSNDCLEYVIVHELVHLLEASHNLRFKALMTKFLPNWKSLKKKLNEQ